MRLRRYLVVCLPLVVLVIGAGWFVVRVATGNTGPPNVVLIVIDTARQDRLSVYGHTRETSPNLRALAAESRTYVAAYATSSWTAPSHASLFTGLYPVAHHCTQERWQLGDHLVTLAEVLSAGGYRTVGIVENPSLSKRNRFDQGFAQYHEVWKIRPPAPGARGATTLSLFRRALNGQDESAPFFVFVNLIGPHSPYDSSGRFMNRFVTDPSIRLDRNLWPLHYLGQIRFTPAELGHLRELYDAELLAADDAMGKMVEALRRRDLLDETILIVTSDHGENIGDHGHMDHVFSLYETTIKIPLIIRYPPVFAPNSRLDEPVQLTDIVPTVLGIVGLNSPGVRFQGRDLRDGQPDPARIVFCEYYKPLQAKRAMRSVDRRLIEQKLRPYDRRIRAVIQDNVKLIWASDGRHEMYDLSRDPDELLNLFDEPQYAATREALMAKLMATVGEYVRAPGGDAGEPDQVLDDKTLQALRSLGYLD